MQKFNIKLRQLLIATVSIMYSKLSALSLLHFSLELTVTAADPGFTRGDHSWRVRAYDGCLGRSPNRGQGQIPYWGDQEGWLKAFRPFSYKRGVQKLRI